MGFSERFKEVFEEKHLSMYRIAKEVNVSPSSVSRYMNGESVPTGSKLQQLASFLGISSEWLLTGKGVKYMVEPALSIVAEDSTNGYGVRRGVPYFDNVEATCSIVSQFNDYPETPTFYINYEHFNDCSAYIPVVGDSMYPQYCAGEIVAVKQIFNLDVIQWGEAYFVVTNEEANNLRTIKQIHWHDDPSKITLRASNPNFRGDTVINKSDIVSIFIIKGKIKRNQL